MAKKQKKWCHFYHKIWFTIMFPLFKVLQKVKYNYVAKPYKLDKKQNYFIISNHSCSIDPFMVSSSFFGRPIYYVASDDLLRNKFVSSIMHHAVAPIPIKKGSVDLSCIKQCKRIATEGGTIGIFPEGNRTYSGNVSKIDKSLVKFIRLLNIPVILYHIYGGYGCDPRWGNKARRSTGAYGQVEKVLSLEEISLLTDEELLLLINNSLSQKDDKLLFKSKHNAEYLERVLFICPKCHKLETIYSHKNKVICSSCGFNATYNEDLTFSSTDESFKIKNVAEWLSFEKEYLKSINLSDDILLSDNEVDLILTPSEGKKEVINHGKLVMYKDCFILDNGTLSHTFYFCDISALVNQGKHKVLFYVNDETYQFNGLPRFSSYKYYLMYHLIKGDIDNTL